MADDTHGLARLVLRRDRDPELNARLAAAGLGWVWTELSEVRLDSKLREAVGAAGTAVPAADAAP